MLLRSRWGAAAAVFVLAAAVRGVYLWQIAGAPFFDLRIGDGVAYHEWAVRIAKGDWVGQGVFYQAPLYPYFLAVLYQLGNESVGLVRVVQAGMGATACGLLAWAGVALFGVRGALAGALLAVYPAAIFQESLVEKTALVTLLTVLLVALVVEGGRGWKWLGGAGVVLGMLGLVRENALLLGVPVLVWIWKRGKKERAAFVVGCALVLVPVGLRNLVVGGEFHLTTSQFGPNLFIGNHVGADGGYQPLVTGHANAAYEQEDAKAIAQQVDGRVLTAGEVSRFWTRQALHFITTQPGDWVALMGRKVALVLNRVEKIDGESIVVYGDWSWVLRVLGFLHFGVMLGLAMAGLLMRGVGWRKDWLLPGLVVVYVLGTALFYVFARYRLPLVPLLLLVAVGGWSWDRKRWRLGVVGFVAGMAFSYLPVASQVRDRAVNYLAIANALAGDAGRREMAVEYYKGAITQDPGWAVGYFGLGNVYLMMGRAGEAIGPLQSAVRLWPNYAEAHFALSSAWAAVGRPAEAAVAYQEGMAAQGAR
ncbi:MAG: glycosyltransferase family 39 protein [Acidobacteria bacterium]|nr:glycosyltransferase family 39 protein [Acidobacteriota bacterium]